MTTKTLPDSTTAAYYYNGSGATLVNTGVQGRPGASGINFGFVVGGNNDTLINHSTILAQRVGVYVTGSGDSVTNVAGGTIVATLPEQGGINFYNFSGTVTNYGVISGYAGATLGDGGNAVELRDGGLVTNFGTLEEGGALFRNAAGTLINSGVILGNAAYGGVYMEAGGNVTNLAGGLISANGATSSYQGAPPYGVFIHGGGSTITNAGTIDGGSGNAVLLATGLQNRVVVDPGAVFVGTVNGGTAVDATLELASGASQGTISGVGSQFINFGTLAFDSSASWLVKTTTAAASTTITGFGATDTIDLSGFVAVSDTFASNKLVLTNASNAHVTLSVQGSFTSSNFSLASDGSGGTDLTFTTAVPDLTYGQTIDEAGIVATTETVSAGVMTLSNAGGTVVGSVDVGTSLSSGDFTLKPDGSGGTDVIVSSIFGTYLSGATLLTNPTTIASTGKVSNSVTNGKAVTGPTGTNWTLTNQGLISETASGGIGVSFAQSGTITNASGGTITAASQGIVLTGGGVITNASGGLISVVDGIDISAGAAASVVNAGQIVNDGADISSVGIALSNGGTVSNQTTGTIQASYGIKISGAAGSVMNLGLIDANYNAVGVDGVYLKNGGEVINGATGGTVSTARITSYALYYLHGAGVKFGSSGTDTLINYGAIYAQGGIAVRMTNGTVINGPSGATGANIQASGDSALTFSSTGTVFNYGTIFDHNAQSGGSTTNPRYYGVLLAAGGIVNNIGSNSLIEGYVGVYGKGGVTVTNAGTIASNAYVTATYLEPAAVMFGAGTNRLIVDPGAVFAGPTPGQVGLVDGAGVAATGTSTLEFASAAATGTISGLGTQFINFPQIIIDSGANWVINGANSIASGVTLTNAGTDTVTGTLVNAGLVTGSALAIVLGTGGHITNQSGGMISASSVAVAGRGAGTLVNGGRIGGNTTTGFGVSFAAGGLVTNQSGGTIAGAQAVYAASVALTVVNAGSIAGSTAALSGDGGVKLAAGGSVSNQSGGVITGNYGVYARSGTAEITNAGSIGGVYGVVLDGAASSVTNQAGGVISGSSQGVFANPAVTVVNAGRITGAGFGIYLAGGGTVTNQSGGTISGASDAVLFLAGYTGRLVIDPSATFAGTVDGGNAIGAGSVSTLELGSGASTGTLTGFGSQYINFAQVTIDAGAQWDIVGSDTAAGLAGATISGFGYGDTIDVTNFAATGDSFSGNHLTLTNGGGTVTLDIQGGFITQQFHITSDGGSGTAITLEPATLAYGDTLDQAGIVVTSETVAGGVMTLFDGASPVGTIGVGTTLDTSDFTLLPDGSSGTDVVVSTVFGTYTSGVTLLTNPTTIASNARVSNSATSAAAVIGLSGTAWTLTNFGSISESGSYSAGISLASGGTIINASGGIVSAASSAIRVGTNAIVTNLSGGTISGANGVLATGSGVDVVNSGLISGSSRGVTFTSGGTISNLSGGTIESASFAVVVLSGAAAITNAGVIAGSGGGGGAGIYINHGGLISNQSGGVISGLIAIEAITNAATVVNAGSLGGTGGNGDGVKLTAGGTVTNQSGGVISGKYGILATSAAVAVINAGTLAGGSVSGAGVDLLAGGTVTNQSGGTITGLNAISMTGGTVTNAGGIYGNTVSGSGISLAAGGSVTNLSGGVITGFDGILAAGGATVVNAGSIGGTTAVAFGSGVTNRLVFDPGAVFSGTVNGGNTIGGSSISTLELGSGASSGTFTGLGSQFVNFAQITIDSGANWTFAGTNSLVAGATLTNSGTLADTGTLINSGTLTGNRLNLDGGVLTNQASGVLTATYVYGVAAGGADTVVNQGTISTGVGTAIYLAASGSIANAAGGVITGYSSGVKLGGATATLDNLGQITATMGIGSYGAYLKNGGVVINGQAGSSTSTARIEGYYGVAFKNAAGTLSNYGTILGDGGRAVDFDGTSGSLINGADGATGALIEAFAYGVNMAAGSVTNYATIIASGSVTPAWGVEIETTGTVGNLGTAGLIEGNGGVQIGTDGTVINAGTIASNQGAGGFAVDFLGGNARLIDNPGAVFVGSIFGGTGGTAVLELTSAASAGTIAGLGSTVTNFTSLVFDTGAQWTVAGNDAANGLGTLAISGFTIGDTIDLAGFSATSRMFSSNALVLTDGGGSHETLAIQGGFSSGNFVIAADGSGGTDITFQNVSVPTIIGTASGQTVSDNATLQPFSGVTIGDANPGNPSDTVTIVVTAGGTPSDANGTLSGSGLIETSTGTYELTAGSAAAVSSALDALVFTPTEHQVAAGGTVTTGFTITVADTLDESATDTTTSVIATALNDAPVISGTAAGQTENDNGSVIPFSGVSITDPDLGASETVTITLTDGGTASDADGTLSGTGLTKTGVGTYTLTAGSPGAVTTALDAVVFTPTDHEMAPGSTVTTGMTLSVTDGVVGSPVTDTTTSVITTALNDAPAISGTTASQTENDNATTTPFSAVSITDPDAGASETVTITLTDGGIPTDADGTLSGSGLTQTGVGTYTLASGSPSEVSSALDALVFTPTDHQLAPGGTVTTGMTLSVTDGIVGSPVTDTTTSVITTAANSPPVVSGAVAGQTENDNGSVTPFSGVSITDPDAGASETVTITLTDGGIASDADGTLSGTGLTKTGVGTYILAAGSPAAVTGALDALLFTPTDHEVVPGGTVTTGMTLAVSDGIIGSPVTDTTTSVITTAVNDPPTITSTGSGTGLPNQTTSAPFAGLTVTDPDVGHTDTLTVTLSDATGGTLSNLAGGSYDADTGVYSITGSAADVTTALQGLVFNPTPPAGSPVSTISFDIIVTGPGGSVENNNISVTSTEQVLGLGGTPSNQVVIATSPDGSSFPAPTPGKTNEAVITNPSSGGSYTLPTGYQAAFLGGSADAELTDTSGGNALLVGNSGNDTISASAGNDTLLGGSGNTTMSISGANDVTFAPAGNASVTASGSNEIVYGGSGMLTAQATGTGDAVGLGSGGGAVTLGGSGNAVYAYTGASSIVATGSGDTIGLYTGAASVSLGGSGNAVYAGAGAATIVASGSGNAVGLGSGNATVSVSGSGTGVFGNSGTMTAMVTGTDDTIAGGSGPMNATISGANAVADGGSGTTTLLINGANATIFGNVTGSQLSADVEAANAVIGLGTGTANLTLGGGGAQVFANAGASTILASGSGSDTISLYTGASAITAGGSTNLLIGGNPSGSLMFAGGAGSSTIVGGGATTMFGAAGGEITYAGQAGATASFTAAAGNETLNAALSGAGVMANGSSVSGSADVLIGGLGNDTLSAGVGNTTMTGGAGSNLFAFAAADGGSVTITDFNNNDTVLLKGYGTGAADTALAGATSSGGNTTITLSDNTTITFLDISSAASLTGHVISTSPVG